ncbi:MAG: NACHT domain-containing protein [Gammaproteobacteria bacterium]
MEKKEQKESSPIASNVLDSNLCSQSGVRLDIETAKDSRIITLVIGGGSAETKVRKLVGSEAITASIDILKGAKEDDVDNHNYRIALEFLERELSSKDPVVKNELSNIKELREELERVRQEYYAAKSDSDARSRLEKITNLKKGIEEASNRLESHIDKPRDSLEGGASLAPLAEVDSPVVNPRPLALSGIPRGGSLDSMIRKHTHFGQQEDIELPETLAQTLEKKVGIFLSDQMSLLNAHEIKDSTLNNFVFHFDGEVSPSELKGYIGLLTRAINLNVGMPKEDYLSLRNRVTALEKSSTPGLDFNDFKKMLAGLKAKVASIDVLSDALRRLCRQQNQLPRLFSDDEANMTIKASYVRLTVLKERTKEEDDDDNLLETDSKKTKKQWREKRLDHFESMFNGKKTKEAIALDELFDPLEKTPTHKEGLKTIQRLLIYGRAGIGKSTLLKYIAYLWSLPDGDTGSFEKEEGSSAIHAESEMPTKPAWLKKYEAVFYIPLRHLNLYRPQIGHCSKTEGLADFIAYVLEEELGGTALERCLNKLNEQSAQFTSLSAAISSLLDSPTCHVLLCLDGLDEVQCILNDRKHEHLSLLKDLLSRAGHNLTQTLLSSRPMAIDERLYPQASECKELEVMGFDDEAIKVFIKQYFSPAATPAGSPVLDKAGEDLLKQLQSNQMLWGMAHIPINITLLCAMWKPREYQSVIKEILKQKDDLTLTNIYEYLTAFLQFRLLEKDEQSEHERVKEVDIATVKGCDTTEQLEEIYECEMRFLEILAFEGMRGGEIILSKEMIESAAKQAAEESAVAMSNNNKQAIRRAIVSLKKDTQSVGFLCEHNPHSGEMYFFHLSMQEFFAARYVVRQLAEGKALSVDERLTAEGFIHTERYNGRYEYVFAFMVGLCRRYGKKSSGLMKVVFDALLYEDEEAGISRDLVGHRERLLIMRCLEECGSSLPLTYKAKLLQDIATWIERLLVSGCYEKNTALHRQLSASARVFSEPVIVEAFIRPLKDKLIPDVVKESIIVTTAKNSPISKALLCELETLLPESDSHLSSLRKWRLALGLGERVKRNDVGNVLIKWILKVLREPPLSWNTEVFEELAGGLINGLSDGNIVESIIGLLRNPPSGLGKEVLQRLARGIGKSINFEHVDRDAKESIIGLLRNPPPGLGEGVLEDLVRDIGNSIGSEYVDRDTKESIISLLRERPSGLGEEILQSLAESIGYTFNSEYVDRDTKESIIGLLRERPSELGERVLQRLAKSVEHSFHCKNITTAMVQSIMDLLCNPPSRLAEEVLHALAERVGSSVGSEYVDRDTKESIIGLLRERPSGLGEGVLQHLAEGMGEIFWSGKMTTEMMQSIMDLLRNPPLGLGEGVLYVLAYSNLTYSLKGRIGFKDVDSEMKESIIGLLCERPSGLEKEVLHGLAKSVEYSFCYGKITAKMVQSIMDLLCNPPSGLEKEVLQGLAESVMKSLWRENIATAMVQSIMDLLCNPPSGLEEEVLQSLAQGVVRSVCSENVERATKKSIIDLLCNPPSGLEEEVLQSLAYGIGNSVGSEHVDSATKKSIIDLLCSPPSGLEEEVLQSLAYGIGNSVGSEHVDRDTKEFIIDLLCSPPSGLEEEVLQSLAEGVKESLWYGNMTTAMVQSIMDLLRERPSGLGEEVLQGLAYGVGRSVGFEHVDRETKEFVVGLLCERPSGLGEGVLQSLAEGVEYCFCYGKITTAMVQPIVALLREQSSGLGEEILQSLAKGIGKSFGSKYVDSETKKSIIGLLRERPSAVGEGFFQSLAEGVSESLLYGNITTEMMQSIMALLCERPSGLGEEVFQDLAKNIGGNFGSEYVDSETKESIIDLLRNPPSGLGEEVLQSLAKGVQEKLRSWSITTAMVKFIMDLLCNPPLGLGEEVLQGLAKGIGSSVGSEHVDRETKESIIDLLRNQPSGLGEEVLRSLAKGVGESLKRDSWENTRTLHQMVLNAIVGSAERLPLAIETPLLSVFDKIPLVDLISCLSTAAPRAYIQLFEIILYRMHEDNNVLVATEQGIAFTKSNKFYELKNTKLKEGVIKVLRAYAKEQPIFLYKNKGYAKLFVDEGYAQLDKNDPSKVVVYYERALQLDPATFDTKQKAGVYQNLGCFYQVLGEIQKAGAAFEAAIELAPDTDKYAEYGHFLYQQAQQAVDGSKNREPLLRKAITQLKLGLTAFCKSRNKYRPNGGISYGIMEAKVVHPIIRGAIEKAEGRVSIFSIDLIYFLLVHSYLDLRDKGEAKVYLEALEQSLKKVDTSVRSSQIIHTVIDSCRKRYDEVEDEQRCLEKEVVIVDSDIEENNEEDSNEESVVAHQDNITLFSRHRALTFFAPPSSDRVPNTFEASGPVDDESKTLAEDESMNDTDMVEGVSCGLL